MADSCAICKKTQVELKSPLKWCKNCKTITYCSRECQKADWKNHKKTCREAAASGASDSKPNFRAPFQVHTIKDPTTLLDDILAGVPEKEVYKRLIDSYRLRVEDELKFEGNFRGVYADEDPMTDFKRFLNKAEQKNLLPSWWNKEKRAECEKLGGTKGGWSYLGSMIEKPDVQEEYNDSLMPMKLRMLAQNVYGRGIGG